MDSYTYEIKNIPLKKTNSYESRELSLNTSYIDPSKMSPPNDFMEKLMKRMDNYYSPTSDSNSNSNSNRKHFFTK